MTAPVLAPYVAAARGHAPRDHRLRRIVVRLDPADVARVDALRPRFKAPRAALVRAFVLAGLALAEQEGGTP